MALFNAYTVGDCLYSSVGFDGLSTVQRFKNARQMRSGLGRAEAGCGTHCVEATSARSPSMEAASEQRACAETEGEQDESSQHTAHRPEEMCDQWLDNHLERPSHEPSRFWPATLVHRLTLTAFFLR